MDTRTVERVKGWDSRPFSGGFDALRDLADGEFSGAVNASGAWVFMLNGRVIGVFDGGITDFESADGTAFEAPHPSLPLLYSMRERGGETQAKYYTNDTPLSEASDTLSQKGFTGYVELSENVLSGDYYAVYHGGRSMNVAFVGESEQLLTDEEAFERANDEVGIYEVVAADVEIVDIPEPETPEEGEQTGSPSASPTPAESAGADETPESTSAEQSQTPEQSGAAGSPDSSSPTAAPERESRPDGESPSEAGRSADASESQGQRAERTSKRTEGRSQRASSEQTQSSDEESAKGPLADEQQWRETTSIPSIEPDKSSERSKSGGSAPTDQRRQPRGQSDGRTGQDRSGGAGTGSGAARANKLKAALQAREEKIATLNERLSDAEDERDELRSKCDELRAEVERLREQLESAQAAGGAGGAGESSAGRRLSPQEALSGTNLFVRYRSKGEGTLVDVANDAADREQVDANLRLEHHTQFEVDDVAVEGESFEAFLHGSMEFQFVNWVVTDLLYEIVDTGRQRGMQEVFDAIPDVDRAELRGSVTAESEDGEGHEEEFDVILRDRMGDPLVVANINDSRDPATGEMMGSLVEAASAVGQANDELSGAFQVTKSFFEPGALETAEDATSGGLLTREKRESFVKLSRKRGYHLCLVESRDGKFHLNVPDL